MDYLDCLYSLDMWLGPGVIAALVILNNPKSIMNKQIKFIDLGTMDYKEAWDFQQNLFDEIVEIKKKIEKTIQI